MTHPNDQPENEKPVTPSKKDRLRPLELIGFAAVLAIFAGVIVLMTTQNIRFALICAGIGFIVALIMVALVGLSMKPNPEDLRAREDLENPH